MAEKEERIYVYRFTDDDGICPLEEICTKFPGKCGDCKEIPTRAETVEKMAKALRSNIVETQAQCSCLNMAEAALNAILGETK